ncbi:hypothetical protein DNU06_02385 [Putridiphycobacter roseus]|uniref:Uncharacterized protein n=2 Tax=Putridiphycobacter roseus TaxID=2219161 RepID=A0A2W1NLH9_9FLAO|nr:hypothetical protein DNU06_02385 [Putridiphycobacter roseus]
MIKTNKMKLKNLLLVIFISVLGANSIAQERVLSEDCKKYLSLMGTYGEQEMWRDAANFFVKAYTACGEEKLDHTDWNNARAIYTSMLKIDTTSTRQIELKDTIYWCYETELKHLKTADLTAEYAAKLVKNQAKDLAKIDKLFAESVHELKERLSINEMIYYFYHLVGNYNRTKGEEKEVARNFAIEEYLKLSDYIGIAKNKYAADNNQKGVDGYNRAQGYLDNYFTQLAKDCEMLVEVLAKKVNTLPKEKDEKLAKIQGYLSILEKRGCDQTELYGQLADSAISISPTADAYYAQGNYFKKRNEDRKAQNYFEKAVELEGEAGENLNKYMLSLAATQLSNKSYKAAFNTAKKVNGEEKGKAMIVCAGAIGALANSCGDTTFDRKANYWLADDYMKKASALGEDYSSRYANGAPGTTEFFEAGKKAGDSVYLSCWGESTTVR